MNDLCTLFTCPKPFTGHNALIQRNAFACWRALGLRCIIIGDDSGVAEAAREFGFAHINDVSKTEYGTPLLNDMFEKAQALAETPMICWINSDILLLPSFSSALELATKRWDHFLMIGQRWDIDITKPLPFEEGWPEQLELIRRKQGKLHGPRGIDYFAFPNNLAPPMPPFAVGRPGWDNWFVWAFAAIGVPLLNVTRAAPVLHQNHDYRHIHLGRSGSYNGPEGDMNLRLISNYYPELNFDYASIYRAEWRIDDSRITFDGSLGRWWWIFRSILRRHFLNTILSLIGPKLYLALKKIYRK